jgi:hypothetical protein
LGLALYLLYTFREGIFGSRRTQTPLPVSRTKKTKKKKKERKKV